MTTASMQPLTKPLNISAKARDLFETRIWVFDLSALQPHHESWVHRVMQMRAESPSPIGGSVRSGWNSQKTIFGDPIFKPLRVAAGVCFQHAFREMIAPPELQFGLKAGSICTGKEALHNALAPQCSPKRLFSYYLQVPEKAGAIVFRDPRPGAKLSPFQGIGANASREVNIQPLLIEFNRITLQEG